MHLFKLFSQDKIGYEFVDDSTANISGVLPTWLQICQLLAYTYWTSQYHTKASGGEDIEVLFYVDWYD